MMDPMKMTSVRRTKTMGLFDKRNPRATLGSVIRSACIGAIGGVVFALFALAIKEQSFWGTICWLSGMTMGCAIVGVLIELDGPN